MGENLVPSTVGCSPVPVLVSPKVILVRALTKQSNVMATVVVYVTTWIVVGHCGCTVATWMQSVMDAVSNCGRNSDG